VNTQSDSDVVVTFVSINDGISEIASNDDLVFALTASYVLVEDG